MQAPLAHKGLRIADVKDMAAALIAAADHSPLQFRTERDFYALVLTYLRGRVPGASTESKVEGGRIDFRIGGMNPALLELVVAPRQLKDVHAPTQAFPGHGAATQLYATQNRQELKKLSQVTQATARNRYLLLLDFHGTVDTGRLEEGYLKQLPKNGEHAAIRVIYACRDSSRTVSFQVGGKKKGRRRKLAN